MSDFISAIKRFIEDWERNHPAALVHYEPAEDVVDEQADEPPVEISQLPEPEVPRVLVGLQHKRKVQCPGDLDFLPPWPKPKAQRR